MRPFLFTLRPPRHPLARFALGLVGAALLAVLVLFGLVAVAAVLLGFGAMRLLARPKAPRDPRRAASPDVIEGEFSVVEKPRQTLGTN